MSFLQRWRERVRSMKTETHALWLAYRDPRTPWYAKMAAAAVVAYLFSPIDLIPDPIPVIGHLDDLLLVPLGIVLAAKLVPHEVMEECRARAQAAALEKKPTSWVAAAVVVVVWVLVGWWLWRVARGFL